MPGAAPARWLLCHGTRRLTALLVWCVAEMAGAAGAEKKETYFTALGEPSRRRGTIIICVKYHTGEETYLKVKKTTKMEK